MRVTGGWRAKGAAGLGIEDTFTVNAIKINNRWYFAFEKDLHKAIPDDLKISGTDFSFSTWNWNAIMKKIAKLMVRHDIAKRILDNTFRSR